MTDTGRPTLEARMERAVEAMERDFATVRTGRAATSLVERIQVEYYGTMTPLNQLASISVPEPHQIVIQPWDRGVLGAIEKAIQRSDIGLMPNVDGTVVRLNIPPLTEERRKDLVKVVHKRCEEARVEIRNQRRDGTEELRKQEKDGRIGADEARREQDRIEKLTHHWTDEVDRIAQGQGAGDHGGLMASVPGAIARSPQVQGDEPPTSDESVDRAPRHVAIIMDGNRRWARERGVPEVQGHAAGVDAIRPIVERAQQRGVEVLSIYAFSRENWARASEEVELLFGLLDAAIRDYTPDLVRQGVRVRLLGRMSELRGPTRASIEEALAQTAAGTRMTLNVAFNYSGRSEIVDAVQRCIRDGVPPNSVEESTIEERLYTADLPEVDLLIRTGGDQRISNFLIWQAAYAELYFCDRYWPDFDPPPSTRRWRSTPAGPAGSDARPAGMQQRLISAAVMVPIVLVVFLLGQPWLTLGMAVVAGLAAWKPPACWVAGWPARRAAAGHRRAARRGPGPGLGWRARGRCHHPRCGRHRARGHGRVPGAGCARRVPGLGRDLFGALYVSLLAFAAGILAIAPRDPGGRGRCMVPEPGPGVAAGPAGDGVELRHLRVPRGRTFKRGPLPQPHLAQQDLERRHRRHRRGRRRGGLLTWAAAVVRWVAWCWLRHGGHGPVG